MKQSHLTLLTLLFLLLGTYQQAVFGDEELRFALLIGNQAYHEAPLTNPHNDVDDMEKSLKAVGFRVRTLKDQKLDEMEQAIIGFGELLERNQNSVGLFYFSGHGMQYQGENYLFPIGAMPLVGGPEDLPWETLNVKRLLDTMSGAGNRLNLIFLDACRDNPSTKSWYRSGRTTPGLAPMQAPSGSLIAYAAGAGFRALDGRGQHNSPYARHLTQEILKPGISIFEMLTNVRVAVKKATNDYQEPAFYSNLDGKFCFKGPCGRVPVPAPKPISFIQGSCQDFPFPGINPTARITEPVPISYSYLIRVLRQGVPVYREAEGSAIIKYLDFDTDVIPIKLSAKRIQVTEPYRDTILGWIDKHELLCQITNPLMSQGVPYRAFVKIATETEDYRTPLYPSSNRNECSSPACEPMSYLYSRFQTHFVFAIDEAQERYLLASGFTLGSAVRFPLLGWIDKEYLIPWNTNLGIRPKNDDPDPKTPPIAGYSRPLDSRNKNRKPDVEILAGNIWYTFPLHMPLIDIVDGYYHVVVPDIEIKGFKGSTQIGVVESSIEKTKRVDVFFILDGTASMAPYIRGVKTAVQQVVEVLHEQPRFKETTFRFGFLVYRDHFADKLPKDDWCRGDSCEKLCDNGICETMPLANVECKADTAIAKNIWYDFEYQIDLVKATSDDSDDYPENLFGGLTEAVTAIANCEDNAKLVFVIGDHGDRQDRISQSVIDRWQRDFPKLAVYFIQTPNNESQAKTPYLYRIAYNDFRRQAFDFLYRLYPDKRYDPEEHFLSLNESNLVAKIIEQVKFYSNSAIINELEQIIVNNGESVKEAIEKYRRKEDFPVLYWDWVEKEFCKQVGEQCDKPVKHQLEEFYIPIREGEMQVEVALIEKHLDQWVKLLTPLTRLGSGLNAQELRQKLVEALAEEIQNIIGSQPISVDDPRDLLEMLELAKNALPLNQKTPLLQYSFKELLEEIPDCELKWLIDWVQSTQSALTKILTNPTLKVSYILEDHPPTTCPLTEKGKKIKRMVFGPRHKLGEDDSYRYGHALGGITLFWLPMELLP
jgi:hypothetical protein